MLVQSFRTPTAVPDAGLTAREAEILELLAKGYTNKEIAETLGSAFHTIHTHVRNIYDKLHVNSRASAVAKLLKE
jgi:DNA-binding NarL/FixJ family response regulator